MNSANRPDRRRPVLKATSRRPGRQVIVGVTILAVFAVGILYMVFRTGTGGTDTRSAVDTGGRYQVGSPGIGQVAPSFTLSSTAGGTVSLSDYHGQTVLLYFHEGLGCQPCWDQIRDLTHDWPKVRAAGVDQLVTITTGPVNLIAQKMRDDKLSATALSDPNLAVSQAYSANQYGMMGTGADGHTFIVVGPTGIIQWRADYGGAPNYTMYVTPSQLLTDMRAGRSS